ncbi:MarR family transcriptional regulator [Pseudonocardia oroxyli]|uniref:MarR family transcriptional regulator n=1 Tax=Pseudonocardia oroxyli TaxID=366584 RepID=UPI001FDF88BF|nr:MarR family transcriptional regulator [Pseudonocardia oroxyli]
MAPHVHGPDCDHSADKPIGWWLRHVDGLIESSMDRVLADEGIGRRHWQALNAVAGGADTEPALDAALAPFGGASRLVLDQLRAQHWIQEIAGRISLTPTGSAARGRLVVAIRDYRARITEGVSEEQYRTTVETLARMARNLS